VIIIGELINSTRKKIYSAIEARDMNYIKDIAKKQVDAGANYVDVNSGAFVGKEPEYMEWLIKTVREVTDAPLSIDSPNIEAIEVGLKLAGENAIVNSITAEKEKFGKLAPIVKKYNASVIALSMDDRGMLDDANEVLQIIEKMIMSLNELGIPNEKIFIDPLIKPISTNTCYGLDAMSIIEKVMTTYRNIHTICGLSNVSFGLPKRKLINQTFLMLLMAKGLDSAIIDPLDNRLMGMIATAEMLLGKDNFCMNYLNTDREGKLEGLV